MMTTATIDWSLIQLLANRAALAYDQHTVSDAATDAQALVLAEVINGEPAIIVAFRGSQEPQDFIQDAKFTRTVLSTTDDIVAEVHQGFLEDFEAINVAVVAAVRNLLATQPTARIYITGHSLGGGIAILAGLEFSRQGLPVENVITFGQPRVGNYAFAAIYWGALGDRTFHVINANDPVPLFPPLLLGYRDEGNEIFLPRGGSRSSGGYAVNPSISFTLFNDLAGILDSWRHCQLAFLPNHFIKAYQEKLALL